MSNSNSLDVILYVIDQCQLACDYCYNKLKFPRTRQLADLDRFCWFVEELVNSTQRHIDDLVLVGGEPTLHPDLPATIYRLLKIKAKNVILWTNLEQDLETYYIPLLEAGCNLAMSWHGKPDDKLNKSFIQKALALPNKFIQNGQITELDLMAEQDNFQNFSIACKMLEPKYKEHTFIWPVYTTDLKIGQYTQEQLKKYQQLINKLNKRTFTIDNNKCGLLEMQTPEYNYCGWRCNAGLDYIYVHCDGNVYNCQSYYQFNQKPMFNINSIQSVDKELLKPCICQVQSCRFADYQVHRENANTNIID